MAEKPQTDDKKLRLKAEDEEDLAVLSAVLQDALVAVGDMAFQPVERRFVLVANRFRHEDDAKAPPESRERVMTGLRIDNVTGVKRRGFNPGEAERLLVLLAVGAGAGAIYLDFAGGVSIRLESGRILCHLDDFGEPWPTRFRPSHPVEDAG